MTFKPSHAVRLKEEMRVLTPRKIYNLIMQAAQIKLKSARTFYLPTRLSIETGNICNLKCPLCPTGRREGDKDWIPDDPRYCAFDLERKDVKKKKRFCSLLWKESAINWEGSVLPCCSVYQEKYSFGNAFEQGFKAVWNGPMYRSARAEVARNSADPKTVCHICKSTGFTHF